MTLDIEALLGDHYAASILRKGIPQETMQAMKDAIANDPEVREKADRLLDELAGILNVRGRESCIITTFKVDTLKTVLS